MSEMPLVCYFIVHIFPSGKLTSSVGCLFHLLLICVSQLKWCRKTRWANIEWRISILHWWIILWGSKYNILYQLYLQLFFRNHDCIGGAGKFYHKCQKYHLFILYCESVFLQCKDNIECWLFLPPVNPLYQSIGMLWKTEWAHI